VATGVRAGLIRKAGELQLDGAGDGLALPISFGVRVTSVAFDDGCAVWRHIGLLFEIIHRSNFLQRFTGAVQRRAAYARWRF
jgi:hypothetical protein